MTVIAIRPRTLRTVVGTAGIVVKTHAIAEKIALQNVEKMTTIVITNAKHRITAMAIAMNFKTKNNVVGTVVIVVGPLALVAQIVTQNVVTTFLCV